MNWVIWQQHKKQFLIVSLLLAAFAALAIPTGLHFWDTYQNALANCTAAGSCDELSNQLFANGFDSRMLMFMKAAIIAVPFILSIFWGVPLVAREYNENTHLLAWTQGVSRRKWLATKLVWVLVMSLIVAGAFAALSTWWWRTGNALYIDRFHDLTFGTQGVVPVASAFFAVSLGIALGTWLKRILPAIGLTIGLLVLVQVVLPTVVRPHYAKPVVETAALSLGPMTDGAQPGQAKTAKDAGPIWIIQSDLYSKNGDMFNWSDPQECGHTQQEMEAIRNKPEKDREPGGYVGRDGGKIVSLGCLAKAGYKWHVTYHPADRYWKFQYIETAIYIGLALIPLAATYWLVLKRDA